MRGATAAIAMLAFALGGCDRVFGLHGVVAEDAPAEGLPPPDALPATLWSAVAGGAVHTCGIRVDQTLWCWGRNDAGQLGTSATDVEVDVPKQVGTASWLSVTAAAQHTCGIQRDNTLWCWGENDYGELGIGIGSASPNPQPSAVPAQVPGMWSAVATGDYHTCAIATSGLISCWGYGTAGELGGGEFVAGAVPTPSPQPIISTATWTAIGAGHSHTCALRADQTAWCWGDNTYGELGTGTNTSEDVPVQAGSDTFAQLAVGYNTTCGVRTDNKLRCWGEGDHGEDGDDLTSNPSVPTAVDDDASTWSAVAVGGFHVCGLQTDNSLWCWGFNTNDELALDTGTARFRSRPGAVMTPMTTWTGLGLGQYHTCAIDSDHQLWCAGRDTGALGTASGGARRVPVQVGTTPGGIAGGYATCTLANTALQCWGDNAYAELGDGTTDNRDAPTPVPGMWMTAAMSSSHACAIGVFGAMSCWGDNYYYELGNATMTNSSTPTPTASVGGAWVTVAANSQSCGIDSGNVYCWGLDNAGQAGGSLPSVPTPMLVSSGTWTAVGTGVDYSCGVNASGVHCWGNNDLGQLGIPGPQTNTPSTASVLSGLAFGGLTVGANHACAEANENFYCWGYNGNGELGDQTTAGSATPFEVPGAWKQLAAGDAHTCGIQTNGTLWCWGANEYGELGLGTFTEHHEPTAVGSDTDWNAVVAGAQHTCATKQSGALYCWGRNIEGEIGDSAAWRTTLAVVH